MIPPPPANLQPLKGPPRHHPNPPFGPQSPDPGRVGTPMIFWPPPLVSAWPPPSRPIWPHVLPLPPFAPNLPWPYPTGFFSPSTPAPQNATEAPVFRPHFPRAGWGRCQKSKSPHGAPSGFPPSSPGGLVFLVGSRSPDFDFGITFCGSAGSPHGPGWRNPAEAVFGPTGLAGNQPVIRPRNRTAGPALAVFGRPRPPPSPARPATPLSGPPSLLLRCPGPGPWNTRRPPLGCQRRPKNPPRATRGAESRARAPIPPATQTADHRRRKAHPTGNLAPFRHPPPGVRSRNSHQGFAFSRG